MSKKSQEPELESEAGTDGTAENESKGKKGKDRLSEFLASELMAKIRKAHGGSILSRASDFKVQDRPRIPTGIFPLDYALGGGFPVGLMNTVYGQKSAGKSNTLLMTIAQAQQMCSTCYRYIEVDAWWGCKCKKPREFVAAYLDVEGTLDLPWAKCLGVDTERMMLSIPEYAEQALDIGEALLRSGDVDILVLDSLAFLTPQKEITESHEKGMQGEQPRLIGRGMRKFGAALNALGNETGRRTTVLFTNQIRYKFTMFGNPETTSGGQAPGFAAATETRLTAKKYEMDEDTGKPVFGDFEFKVEKNKTSGAKMEGMYRLYCSDGTKKKGSVYDEDQLVDWGEKVGVIHRAGGYQCNGETFQKKEQLTDRLVADAAFKRKLGMDVMKLLLAS